MILLEGLSSLHTSSTDNSVPTSEASISVGDVPVGDQLSESEIANGDQGEQAEVTGDSNQTGEQEVNGNEAEADASTNKPDVIKPTPTGNLVWDNQKCYWRSLISLSYFQLLC